MNEKDKINDIPDNDAKCVLPVVNIDSILKERHKFYQNTGRQPDYIMIHACNKRSILEEAQLANIYELMCPINHKCFGMKVIWTNDIAENEVICTYNGR